MDLFDFNSLLERKTEEIKKMIDSKTKINTSNIEINYAVKTTVYKIQAEQEKKKRESKRNQKDYTELL